MAPPFKDVIESGQFTFLVGEESKSIVAHVDALASLSVPLGVLMNGKMSEAKSRTAKISDVQVDDFIRFCEYAYTGDYTVPGCQLDDPEVEEAPESSTEPIEPVAVVERGPVPVETMNEEQSGVPVEEPVEVDPWGYPMGKKKKKAKVSPEPSKQAKLRRRLRKRIYAGSHDHQEEIGARHDSRTNQYAYENFTPVFLAHARLYTFARMWFVFPLKALTLNNLRNALLEFTLYTNRIGDVLELVRYVYSNEHTDDRKENGEIDQLRKLVVEYIACEIDTFGKSSQFTELIEEGGEFAGDFWCITRDHLL